MTNEEAIGIVYNLTVKFLRTPLTDEELDALFKVRTMLINHDVVDRDDAELGRRFREYNEREK